jgi:YD repeat-containing protein
MQLRSVCATLAFVTASGLTSHAWAGTTYYFYDAQGRVAGNTTTTGNLIDQFRWDGADNRTLISQGPIAGPSQINVLSAGQGLVRDQAVWSTDGRYELVMQNDGNLVLYGPSGYMWQSRTGGSEGAFVIMGGDGNLALYDVHGNTLWTTGTSGNSGAYFTIQTDGNLVVYTSNNTPLWNSGT